MGIITKTSPDQSRALRYNQTMTILVGLGNPGSEYQGTRHNAGVMLVESWVQTWQSSQQWRSPQIINKVAKVWKGRDRILVQPLVYMNDSGRAVQAVLHWFKLPPSHVLVAHDDLDLELGKYKLQLGTGPKVHNGLSSVYQQLGSHDFWHLRLGVDGRAGDRRLPGAEYVLARFSPEEKAIIDAVGKEATPLVEQLCVSLNRPVSQS